MTEERGKKLVLGDVVQIVPEYNERFAGCFMVVDEVKPWGVQGYVQNAGIVGQAWFRCAWDGMQFIGHAVFVLSR